MSIQPRLRDPLDDEAYTSSDCVVQVLHMTDLRQQLRARRTPQTRRREVTPLAAAGCLVYTLVFMICAIVLPELAYHHYEGSYNDTSLP